MLTNNSSVTQEVKVQVQMLFTTVVQKLNQGTFRHRGVSDGGLFFVSFWRTCPDERNIFGSKKKRKKHWIEQS